MMSNEQVVRIRKVYVDQRATVVAIGRRIARGVNRDCKPAQAGFSEMALFCDSAGVAQW